jgi:tetratricopeptide repeat protein 21B
LLKMHPKNDVAGSILAEILLKSNQYDKAIEQFQKMLEEEPDKYGVLAKLIDFFRRSNQLDEAKKYIEKAQNRASNTNDAGLCYCRGLYHKYARNPSEALVEFNKGTHACTQPKRQPSTLRTL